MVSKHEIGMPTQSHKGRAVWLEKCLNIVLNVAAVVVATFNKETALVGAFSENTQLKASRMLV